MRCNWCEKDEAKSIVCTVYWELPDGLRAIEILDTPAIHCLSCGMEYQTEDIIEELEDHLMLIDTEKIGKSITYDQLMSLPKLLKRNYFRFN
ncbi:YokU family protein [Salipaludibacillus neizhouensis]|uniref:YokU family protein n=1 Tax=Salipaludibacillus neizhouensis TaxID=885475 RepID=A0A3A9K5V2_9BACI|nr:YokU family protein [Salipaludibacillus neizhouensis]RKL65681.1 YokU family protein [Salipaludibacillus neizhouensis]